MNTNPRRQPLVKTFSACTYTPNGLKLGTTTAWKYFKISALMFYGRGVIQTVVMSLN